jgi:anti-sigma factor RsiW
MDCQRISGIMTAAALGEIRGRELTALFRHLSACERCRRQLQVMRRIVRLVDCALLGLPSMAGLPHGVVARTG